MPCVEEVEWILSHMDDSDMMLCSKRGGNISTEYGEDMKTK